jgi:hypothetical protein
MGLCPKPHRLLKKAGENFNRSPQGRGRRFPPPFVKKRVASSLMSRVKASPSLTLALDNRSRSEVLSPKLLILLCSSSSNLCRAVLPLVIFIFEQNSSKDLSLFYPLLKILHQLQVAFFAYPSRPYHL